MVGTTPAPRALVIGLGAEHRGDDRIGLDVARALRPRARGEFDVAEAPGDASGLLDLWVGRETVVVVDAVRSGSPPGTVRRVELGSSDLPEGPAITSTHGLSLREAVALGRAVGRMPRHLTVVGVEADDLGLRDGLSVPVARALGVAVQAVLLALADRASP